MEEPMWRACIGWALARSVVLVLTSVLFAATSVRAQAPSSIAGVVKDTTGAVMPGVTVEASSTALIERVKTAITDSQGQYRIVDLRPGTYTVTFTLPGFSTVKHEGLELSSGFTATANADLKVGSLEESITVSGQTPLVDVQNTKEQQVLTAVILETIPSNKGFSAFVALTPGISIDPSFQDVGGTQHENAAAGSIWGSRQGEFHVMLDGMHAGNILGSGGGRSRGIMLNNEISTESNIAKGGSTAETDVAGIVINLIPKEGGNKYSGFFLANGTGNKLQSGNITDELRARGLNRVNTVDKIWDFNATLGGPIRHDNVWFFGAARYWGVNKFVGGNYWNATQGTPVYTPDLNRPAVKDVKNQDYTGRITWQVSPKNKVNFHHMSENIKFLEQIDFASLAPEAAPRYQFYPDTLSAITWSSPVSSKLLFEAGGQFVNHYYPIVAQPGVKRTDIAITELSTNYTYNALGQAGLTSNYGQHKVHHYAGRFSASYITGSHAFKTGVQVLTGKEVQNVQLNRNRQYAFLNGVPASVTLWDTPFSYEDDLKMNLGIYAQDQWTVKRLTVNAGVRYDQLNGEVPANFLPAAEFRPALNLAAVKNVPDWKDLNVRFGAAYDLFGDGRTALKANIGRYVVGAALSSVSPNNPALTVVNNVTRTWADTNGDFVPDCELTNPAPNGECGATPDNSFGTTRRVTSYADEVNTGFAHRPYNWLGMVELQHELTRRMSAHVGWVHRWYGNFPATANLAVTPADFNSYSILAPSDSRLPNGGQYAITGLYDVIPTKFGQVSNLVNLASKYGEITEKADFLNFTLNARLPHDANLSGGFDTGRNAINNCDVVLNNPQIAFPFYTSFFTGATGATAPRMPQYCDVVIAWRAQRQFKIFGSYPLPGDVRVSANLQSTSGIPRTANYVATNALIAPSLGRNLAAGVNGTVVVDLIPPYTQFEDRINQLDFRLTKIVRIARSRIEAMVDLYNALNASPILSMNTRYGSSWLRPIQVLDGRIVKFGVQYTF
jgi:hypothetical protein